MHSSRRAAAAAVSLSLALGGVTAAHADDSTVLYVDGPSTSCTDSGTGAEAAPYCTIQAAADAAVAGDIVEVATGTYTGQVDIKSTGTSTAPVVFEPEGTVKIVDASGDTGPSLSFDGASHVNFEGQGTKHFVAYGLVVNGSTDISLDGVGSYIATGVTNTFEVTGTSSNVSLTRSEADNVQIDAGSSGDVISTNWIEDEGTLPGISITGATDTDVTSNDVEGVLASANSIGVYGGSTGTSIENNIVTAPRTASPATTAVEVDASSAAGTTLDYNVVHPAASSGTGNALQSPYSWAGTSYASAAALASATGQGAHDLNTPPMLGGLMTTNSGSAPQINSANSAAPGMLATDFYSRTCSGDPAVAVTGAGTPADCARGAVQQTYSTAVKATAASQGALSMSLGSYLAQTYGYNGTMGSPVNGGPTPAVSYTIAWGDGQTQTVQASATATATSATHTYAKVGTYTITDTANLTDGTTVSTTASTATNGSGFVPLAPKRILDTRYDVGGEQGALPSGDCYGMPVSGVDGIPSNATAVAVNLTVTDTVSNGIFSLGSDNTASNLNYSAGQTVANSAIVPINDLGGVDVCSGGDSNASADAIVDVTGYFTQTTGAGYQPMTPGRILDTRYGTGAPKAKIGAKTGLSLAIAGADSIPSDVTAVAVHVTETNATGSGWIAAEPDGAGVPTTSSLNYGKGQTISNTLIVPVAADGKIELYNGAVSGSVDLIADVSGYFSATAPDAFMPVTPFRAVDTRKVGSKIGIDGTETFSLDSTLTGASAGFPADATIAANVTATDETAGGALTVYPAGTSQPIASALNHGTNQNIANFGLFATSSSADSVDVYNNSPGSTDVIFDVFGYFTSS